MASFSVAELNYLLSEGRLGSLATVDATGLPHVVPVGWRSNSDLDTIDISGRNFAATKKFRNVRANLKAAFLVDDVLPPWRPRSVMVQGQAEALEASTGGGEESEGAAAMIRITPEKIISWGLETAGG